MGYRLSKIYTRTGDKGETGLGDGSRTAKDSARIEALGAIDELNSHVGALAAETIESAARSRLLQIQHDLFDLGGEVSIPGHAMLADARVDALEAWLDEYNATLAPLKEFILPGGSRAGAQAHIARTVCRRAERALVGLTREASVTQPGLRYLNRLSDLLFVLARVLNRAAGTPDVTWQRSNPPA